MTACPTCVLVLIVNANHFKPGCLLAFHQISLDSCEGKEGVHRDACIQSLYGVNTCYAGAIRPLRAGDKIKLDRALTERKVIIGSTETFFGLAKI